VCHDGQVAVRFGDCELSVERHELRRGGEVTDVEPQVFDVLAHLVRHRDRVVAKTELLDEIWGDRFVSESALTSRIKSARRAIGDTGRDQRVIKTIHGRGYRFVAAVIDDGDGLARGDGAAWPAGSAVRGAAGAAAASDDDPPALQRVLRALGDLASGAGVAIRIDGGTRTQRSEIVHRLADAARDRSFAVGLSAPSITAANSFAYVADALDEMTQRRPDLLEAVPPGCRHELERVVAGDLPTTRQRWLVAVRELLVAAAERAGAVVLLDHVDHAPPEALALVDDVARLTRGHRLALIVAGRPGRGAGGWWTDAAPRGFEVVELTDEGSPAPGEPRPLDLPADVVDALRRVALSGERFDELELRAASGHDEPTTHRLVELALGAGAIVLDADGYRFADEATADRLTADMASPRRARLTEQTARRLAELGAPPERTADRFLSAGCAPAAAPHALAAARRAAGVRLHREVLRWTDVARDHVDGGAEAELLSLRADALAAMGDPAAVPAYRAALAAATPDGARSLRARLGRAALFSGDIASAEEALAGLEPDGGPGDGALLLARGMLAYFSGDLDAADAAVEAARSLTIAGGSPTQLLDVITLQGMVAHNRGEWFDRLRHELRATNESRELASTVFDSHLCVAEYLLYGPTPYDEVIALAHQLRTQAEQIGARPAAAFALAVAGEAALLGGDLDAARTDLTAAVELHSAMGADTGAAHALQRLAEVELAVGDRAEAERLLRRALPLARWSPLVRHLLQRIYGTLVAAAPDPDTALAIVDEAVEAADERTACVFCHVMIAVPASIACAEGGRLDEARSWLAQAEASAALWQGTAWQAAVREARAHLARAEDDDAAASRLLSEAALLFETAGQPLDAQRCREAVVSFDV
jgi:DNA-binding winged helix-turn-helix (wHTH) protein/tetratricopeptide (TPR) repeat protein